MGCPWSKSCQSSGKLTTQSQTQIEAPTIQLEQAVVIVIGRPEPTALDFEEECLAEHNRLRALHGCPPLQLDRDLWRFAAEWALEGSHRLLMGRRYDGRYGENIYPGFLGDISGKDVVKFWYDEIEHYNFRAGDVDMKADHFTQVVWKSAKKLGVGVEKRDGRTWVVANYDVPANCREYKKNVPPLRV